MSARPPEARCSACCATARSSAATAGDEIQVVLDRTPFYAEGGGQVGDTGTVATDDGAVVEVLDTVPALGECTHRARVREGEVRVGQAVHATVDGARRQAVTARHSATHVLHWALRTALGEHAAQRGSLVDAGRLRSTSPTRLRSTPSSSAAIEVEVNARLLADPDVRVWHTTQDEARAAGAIALSGRSTATSCASSTSATLRELCGGTHVGTWQPDRPGAPSRRVVHRLEPAPHRGPHRRRGTPPLRPRACTAHRAGRAAAGRPDEAPERLRRTLERLATQDRELERMREARLVARAADLAERAQPSGGGWMVVEAVPGAEPDGAAPARACRARPQGR